VRANNENIQKPRIALWHRYGPGGHTACGGHAIPSVIESLAEDYEVHYFGFRSKEATPDKIQAHATIHRLPFLFDRSSTRDKLFKTILWYLAMPFMALQCRFMGVRLIFIDETVPLTAPIVMLFFGKDIALTVMDFFLDIYLERNKLLRPIIRPLRALDFWAWSKIPVIFTKVTFAKEYLAQHGVPADRIHVMYNPCDTTKFFPIADKAACKARFGFKPDDLVMVHHGVLHPNKGNDIAIKALVELREEFPTLHFLLIGDGPERKRLETLARKLGVSDRVTFTGWLPDEATLNEGLNAGDIGLVLRIGQFWDNFHMTDTLVHNMACGLPILATDLEGISEALADCSGASLFAPRDLDCFRSKLRYMLNEGRFSAATPKTASSICRDAYGIPISIERISTPLRVNASGKTR